jgi:hypothetical protein
MQASSTLTPTHYLPVTTKNAASGAIMPADLAYRGAFRLPDAPGTPDNVGWEWGGTALTYYPGGDAGGPTDGYPGSLFGAGHDQTQHISEVSIPIPVISAAKDVAELNAATTVQPFANIRGSLFDHLDFEMPRAGLAFLATPREVLHFCWATHAPGDDADAGPTHGWSELDLSAPDPAGIWSVGGYPKYVTCDYILDIPQTWADTNTPGQRLATGRYRDGGQGAMGPSLIAYDPWQEGSPPAPGSVLPATPLLLYGNVHDPDPATMDHYHHSDEWSGAAWLTTGGKGAVVFVGTKGQGACWYGCADGTDAPPWPDDCDRGWWSTSFVGQMLFYHPDDLAAVAFGELETWAPQPYATLDLDPYLYHITSAQQLHHVGALAYDREGGLLYLLEPHGDGDKPLVHVWSVQE